MLAPNLGVRPPPAHVPTRQQLPSTRPLPAMHVHRPLPVRRALAVKTLFDGEIEAILRAEPPTERAQYDHERTGARDADT